MGAPVGRTDEPVGCRDRERLGQRRHERDDPRRGGRQGDVGPEVVAHVPEASHPVARLRSHHRVRSAGWSAWWSCPMSKHARPRGLPVDGVERPTADGWTFPAATRRPRSRCGTCRTPGPPTPATRSPPRAAPSTRRSGAPTPTCAPTPYDVSPPRVAEHADELVALMAAETGVPVALRSAHLDDARRRDDVRDGGPSRSEDRPASRPSSRPPPRPCPSRSRRSVACSSRAGPSC